MAIFRNVRYSEYRISQTGHSLGGFSAEIGASFYAKPHSLLREYSPITHMDRALINDTDAVTFDTLGASIIIRILNIHNPQNQLNIINYVANPNLANTANIHIGIKRRLPIGPVAIRK